MPLINKFRYRPEIDGLRAIAVLAVVLFHAGFGLPGGYVGVDVFFVISGFLITSLIWKDLESERFTFANFWERRARRIAPAMVVVTIATLVAGWFLLLPSDFENLGRASASQAAFFANIHYCLSLNYFAGIADEKPLLHTWSLAVEEQFYLIVPFLLWRMFRFAALRTRAAVISILSVGFALSFAVSLYTTHNHGKAAFYLLPPRAWELLLGSLIAFFPYPQRCLRHRSLREVASLTGLALIFIPIFFYTRSTPFPGLAALPPCLGAALVIWVNGPIDAPTAVARLISIRPLVFIGLISYSLYLWHWPLLAFSKYLAIAPLSEGHRAVLVGLGFLFAILSWRYVETPFRTRTLGATRKSVFAFAGTGLVLVLASGLLCIAMKGFPQRFPSEAQKLADAKLDMTFINNLTSEDIRSKKLVPIGTMNSNLQPTVLVWGDSHAMAALPAIDAFLKEKGIAGQAATRSSTVPVLDWAITAEGLDKSSTVYNDYVFSYIESQKFSDVILTARWDLYTGNDPASSRSFDAHLLATVRRLVAAGSRPWILLDVPTQSFDVPRVLSRSFGSDLNIDSLCAKPLAGGALDMSDPKMIAEIEAAGGRILDPKPRFLDSKTQHYMVQNQGVVIYRDHDHLTTKGALLMLLPFFRDSLMVP